MNVILLLISAAIKPLHSIVAAFDARDSWYFLVLTRNIIIMFHAIVLYRIACYYNGRLKQLKINTHLKTLAKYNLEFWLISMLFSTSDLILCYFGKHTHFIHSVAEFAPLIYILLRFLLFLKRGKS